MFSLALLGALVSSAGSARAQADMRDGASATAGARAPIHPRVVLLGLTKDDPLAARLAAELEGLGLEVTRAQIDPTVPIDEMVRQALAGGARGVVVADGRRTEFWVAEEGTDRVGMRQELEIESSPSMESVLSLRTVEFLRASLGLTSRPTQVGPPVVPPPPVTRPAEEERRVALGVCAGVVGATGKLPPYATAGASLRLRVAGPAGLELLGLAPLMTQQVAGADGPIDTQIWLAGGGLLFAPRPAARVTFELAAGAMAAVARGHGAAAGGVTDYAVGLAFYGRAAGRVRLSSSWSARLDVIGGSTAARRAIIAGMPGSADVTAWGVAFVAALAGVEWGS